MKGYCKVYGPTKRLTLVSVEYLLIENCLYLVLFPPGWYHKRVPFPIFKITHSTYEDCQRKTIVKNFDIITCNSTWKFDLINYHFGKKLFNYTKYTQQREPFFCFASKIYRFDLVSPEELIIEITDPRSGLISSVEHPINFMSRSFNWHQSCDRIVSPNLICYQNKDTLSFSRITETAQIEFLTSKKSKKSKNTQILCEFWSMNNVGCDLSDNFLTFFDLN